MFSAFQGPLGSLSGFLYLASISLVLGSALGFQFSLFFAKTRIKSWSSENHLAEFLGAYTFCQIIVAMKFDSPKTSFSSLRMLSTSLLSIEVKTTSSSANRFLASRNLG